MMGTGVGQGEHRAIDAAQKAIASPLLDNTSIDGAKGILLNFTGGLDIALHEVEEAARLVQEAAHEEANIIFGAVTDPNLQDQVGVTVIATGFPEKKEIAPAAAKVVDLPVARPQPVAAGGWRRRAGEPRVDGADPFESVDVDVPAFLRRQAD